MVGCVYVYMCVGVYVYRCVCRDVFMSIYLYTCKCIDMYMCVYIRVCAFHSRWRTTFCSHWPGEVFTDEVLWIILLTLWNTIECSNVNDNSGRASFYIFYISCKILIYVTIYFQSRLTKMSPASKSNKNTYKSDGSAFRLIIRSMLFPPPLALLPSGNVFSGFSWLMATASVPDRLISWDVSTDGYQRCDHKNRYCCLCL